jgi:hypothetical protein
MVLGVEGVKPPAWGQRPHYLFFQLIFLPINYVYLLIDFVLVDKRRLSTKLSGEPF